MAGKLTTRAARKEHRVRLGVEQLEDRAVPATATLLNENFDTQTVPNLPPGWSTSTLAGLQNNWFTTNVGGVFIGAIPSPPNRAAALDAPQFSDSVLNTPILTVPILNQGDPFNRPETVNLTFNNAFDVEFFDGYVLEIAVNGGAFQDITAAGGVFVAGGYTPGYTVPGTPTPPASALLGRPAWNGTTFGPVPTQVELTNVVRPGDTFQLRWRVSSDNTVGSPIFDGVGVDDVVVTATSSFTPNPNERFAVGSGAGARQAQVFVYDATGQKINVLTPFPGYHGDLHVATGDVNGDGVDDIVVAPGANFPPVIFVYDGATGQLSRAVLALPPVYRGGVNVAVGDLNGDGFGDIVATPSGRGIGGLVNVFSGQNMGLLRSFFAYPPVPSINGVSVAVADVNGDGTKDIVTGLGGGGPAIVEAFSGASGQAFLAFQAYPLPYSGGVNVAAGDLNGDGKAEIFTAAASGGSGQINIFNPAAGAITQSFFAYEPRQTQGGVRIATTDVDGDGRVELLTSIGPLVGISSPEVRRFNFNLQVFSGFMPFEGVFMGGGFVG